MIVDDAFISELVAEAKFDEVGLWMIVSRLKGEKDFSDPAALQGAALEYCKQLMLSGVVARFCNDSSLVSDADAAMLRIRNEWKKLGRDPNIGEVVDFVGPLKRSG